MKVSYDSLSLIMVLIKMLQWPLLNDSLYYPAY